MPIRFRCGYCNRLLGIARRKAGSETTCPHCGYTVTVPDDPGDDPTEMEDLDALLNPMSNSDSSPPSTPSPAQSPGSASAVKATTSTPRSAPVLSSALRSPEERPLFEREIDAVLGNSHTTPAPQGNPKPKPIPISGMDALSLGTERSQIVLSVHKATALVVAAVVLIALSFAAGFLIASAK